MSGCDLLSAGPGYPEEPGPVEESELLALEVPIQGYNVSTLGVADLDGDRRDDLYTLNHNARPTLLRSTGYTERPFELLPALPHDPRFPALADLPSPPRRPDTGALVYWLRRSFHMEAGHLTGPVRGTLLFRAQPVMELAKSVEARVEQTGDSQGAVHSSWPAADTFLSRIAPTP